MLRHRSVVCCISLQILVEESVWLRYKEHKLVEDLANHVLPVFLVSLLFNFMLLRVGNRTKSFVFAGFDITRRHVWHKPKVRIRLSCGYICMLRGAILLRLLLSLLVKCLREVQLDRCIVELGHCFEV